LLPLHLLRFEFQYQFARPVTWLYVALIFGQGIWYGLGAYSQFGSRLLWVNSAANAYLVLASPGLILTVVACFLAGQSLTKDLDYKVADYTYATPIADRDYFLGKLLGTLLTVFMLALAYPLGTLAVPLLAEGITGPVPVGQLLNGFFTLLIQNLFVIVCIAFSATVFTRRMTGAYVVMFGMVLYFLVSNLSWLRLTQRFIAPARPVWGGHGARRGYIDAHCRQEYRVFGLPAHAVHQPGAMVRAVFWPHYSSRTAVFVYNV